MRIISVLFGLGVLAACGTPQRPQSESSSNLGGVLVDSVPLTDLYSLAVRQVDQDRTVVVEIVSADQKEVIKRYTVGNAFLSTNSIVSLNLDPSNTDPEYLIRIPDRSSTYGAETGVIVYRLQWWEFLLVPDDWFHAEDVDEDGVFELKCNRVQERAFSLRGGVLREKP